MTDTARDSGFRTEVQGTFDQSAERHADEILLALWVRYKCDTEEFDSTLPKVRVDGEVRVHPNARGQSLRQAGRLHSEMEKAAARYGLAPDFTGAKKVLASQGAEGLRGWADDLLADHPPEGVRQKRPRIAEVSGR